MAEENAAEIVETEAEAEVETDWQAEAEKWKSLSREWEKKSKANKSAAEELEQLKQAQMTEQEKANARAEAAEAELTRLKAEIERNAAAKRVSEKEGVPLSLLEYCEDEESMQKFADEYRKQNPVAHAMASATGTRVVRESDAPKANEAQFVKQLFNKE